MRIRKCHAGGPWPALTVITHGLVASALWGSLGHAAEFSPSAIYAKAAPGVVLIQASSDTTGMSGTGSIIHRDGYVLTNAHVVVDKQGERPYARIMVYLKPDRITGDVKSDFAKRFAARVLGYEQDLDLALLKLEHPPQSLPVIRFGDPATVRIGDYVVAIGHPEQGGLWSLTSGVISQERENFQDIRGKHIFQTETGMNRGNSGGPLLNADGDQVGVNTAIARKAKDGMAITSISYSVKSSVARSWVAGQGLEIEYASKAGPLPSAHQPPVRPTQAPESGLPPKRPYDMDELLRDLSRLERDLTDQEAVSRERIREFLREGKP
jgi:serine protease Do